MYLSIPVQSWFVSENGADSSDCGIYPHPCASFRVLWQHIVNDENKATDNYVETDKDLIIDGMHFHSPDKKVTFTNQDSHVINIAITNSTIDNTDLRFGWISQADSISLRLENCFIQSSRIGFGWLSQPAVIRNCTFSDDTTTDNSMSSQLMSHKRCGDEHPLIDCSYSSITLVNVVVRDNVGCGILFKLCNVQITDSHFTNNNFTEALIDLNIVEGKINTGGIMLYETKAHLINSTFTGNQGHALVVMSRSGAITAGCQFLYNVVKGQGAAVHVSDRSEYHDQGSSFADNIAGEGGKILNKKKHSL